MEPDEYFAWRCSSSLVCGACGLYMCVTSDGTLRPPRPIVTCYNEHCPKWRKIYTLSDEEKVPIFDTGRMAPDTRILQNQAANQAQAAVQAGVNLTYDAVNRTIHNTAPELDPAMVDNIHNLGRPTEGA